MLISTAGKKAIVDVLITRDGYTQEDAEAYFNIGMTMVMQDIACDPYSADEIFQSEFGLEPDYLYAVLGMQ